MSTHTCACNLVTGLRVYSSVVVNAEYRAPGSKYDRNSDVFVFRDVPES